MKNYLDCCSMPPLSKGNEVKIIVGYLKMGKLINFIERKEEREYQTEIKELSKECLWSLKTKNTKIRKKRSKPTELERLRRLNEFNDAFLCLIHIFMREECPELGWRFELFLDKIENE